MLHIVIDTSIYRSDPSRKQVGFQIIEKLAKYGKLTLHIPYFAFKEFTSHQIEDYEKSITSVSKSISELQKKHLPSDFAFWLENTQNEFQSYVPLIRSYIETDFLNWASSINAKVHPISDSHGIRVAEDYFKGNYPFKSKKNREDIPDSFIWHTILDLCEVYENVYVISGDRAFKSACETIQNADHFNSIKDFLASDICKSILPEINFKENIEKFRIYVLDIIDVFQDVFNEYTDNSKDINVQSYDIPSDNGDASIETIYEAENIIIDANEIQYYGDGIFIIPFNTLVDADLYYAIFKGNYYALNTRRMRNISIEELNDHYFLAQETFVLSIKGTFSVVLDKIIVEDSEINNDNINDIVDISNIKVDNISNIEVITDLTSNQVKASDQLIEGQIYTRKQLREIFDIRDATINTGVFRPTKMDSIWLFVTEKKSSDRTQYIDYLDGDTLYWDGQTSGRTDKLIIEHKQQDLEILLFYRKDRKEFPDSGFRYEGIFEYISHEGLHPTHFKMRRFPNFY